MRTTAIPQPLVSSCRIILLFAIFGVAMMGLFAEPYDDSQYWMEDFFISKVIAVVGFSCYWLLYKKWSKTDKWIKAYNASCDKALEAENPCYIGKEKQ